MKRDWLYRKVIDSFIVEEAWPEIGGFRRVGFADREDDAQLFAAAPDLLEACEWAFDDMRPDYGDDHETVRKLRAAIARAKGEEP